MTVWCHLTIDLKKIAIDYKGKTIDNIIQQLELRLADSNLK